MKMISRIKFILKILTGLCLIKLCARIKNGSACVVYSVLVVKVF